MVAIHLLNGRRGGHKKSGKWYYYTLRQHRTQGEYNNTGNMGNRENREKNKKRTEDTDCTDYSHIRLHVQHVQYTVTITAVPLIVCRYFLASCTALVSPAL